MPPIWNRLMAERAANMKASAIRDTFKLAERPDIISFGGGFPSVEAFPRDMVAEISAQLALDASGAALQYGPTEGFYELRETIAEKMRRQGIDAKAENVLVTGGSQQALDLLGKVFLNQQDPIIVEKPTYIGGLSAMTNYLADPISITLDRDGIRTDELEAMLEKRRQEGLPMPKLCYIIPNFHNPTGVTLSKERRVRLVELAEEYDFLIIEDNPYGELRFEGSGQPHIKTFDTNGRVFYLGSYSKVFLPGIRVGWIVADEAVIQKLAIAKQGTDLCGGSFGQQLVLEFHRRNLLDPLLTELKNLYRRKRDLMLAALGDHFPEEVEWTYPEGGFFIWVTLPPYLDAQAILLDAMEEERVAYVGGGAFFADGTGQNTIRLAFSQADDEKIVEGIRRLGRFLKSRIDVMRPSLAASN